MPYTYAIADMHGRYDLWALAVDAILDHAGPNEYPKIVVMGDFIDRGPDGSKLVASLRAASDPGNSAPFEVVVLKGNHEDMAVQCTFGGHGLNWWIGNGGGATLKSYGYADRDILTPFKGSLESDLNWMNSLPLYYQDKHRIFVHADVDPDLPMDQQSDEFMMWNRVEKHEPVGYPRFHVVHGHMQYGDGPILTDGRTNLDTFAWYTGRLAIGVFDDDKPGGPVDTLIVTGSPA